MPGQSRLDKYLEVRKDAESAPSSSPFASKWSKRFSGTFSGTFPSSVSGGNDDDDDNGLSASDILIESSDEGGLSDVVLDSKPVTRHSPEVTQCSSSSDDDMPRKRKRAQRAIVLSEESSADSVEQEAVEEEDLLDDDILDESQIIQSRTRGTGSSQSSQRQKRLQLLKKKQKVESDSAEEEEEEEEVVFVEEDNFVVSDEEEYAEQALSEMPEQFKSSSHQSLEYNFKVVLQLEIYRALQPKYDTTDDAYFSDACKALDRKTGSLRDSALSSTAWKPWFLRAIKERPVFDSRPENPRLLEESCDACNTRGRHATFSARLIGALYDRDTLQPLSTKLQKQGEEARYIQEEARWLAHGEKVPPGEEMIKINFLDATWYLGNFCHKQALICHQFWHWHYHLHHEVLVAMRRYKLLTTNSVFLEGSQLVEEADKVLNILEGKNVVRFLWNKFDDRLDRAEQFLADRTQKRAMSIRYDTTDEAIANMKRPV